MHHLLVVFHVANDGQEPGQHGCIDLLGGEVNP